MNHTTAWQKACSLAHFCFGSLRSARTAKPCETPLNRLICQGWPALIRVSSDSWRSWVVKIWSTSVKGGEMGDHSYVGCFGEYLPAAAMEKGPLMAPSSS